MFEISKELLSELLQKDIEIRGFRDKHIPANFEYIQDMIDVKTINIYETADKAIDWIENQGFWIKKEYKEIYALMKGVNEIYGIDTKNRIDVPFMCMQWILDNKK